MLDFPAAGDGGSLSAVETWEHCVFKVLQLECQTPQIQRNYVPNPSGGSKKKEATDKTQWIEQTFWIKAGQTVWFQSANQLQRIPVLLDLKH